MANDTVDLNGTNQTIGAISGSGTILNSNNSQASTLTINGGGTTATAFNNGTGTLGLTVGGNTLTLTGSGNYTGGTTINGGTLALAPTSGTNNIASSKFINVGGDAILNVTNVGGSGNNAFAVARVSRFSETAT